MKNIYDTTEPRYKGIPSNAMISEFNHNKVMKLFRTGGSSKYGEKQKHVIEFIPDYAWQKYREDRAKAQMQTA